VESEANMWIDGRVVAEWCSRCRKTEQGNVICPVVL
jgi:hypothetical protein